MIGRKIKTVKQVCQLALQKKSVYIIPWGRRCPAAFVQSIPAVVLNRLVLTGNVYFWKHKKK